MVLIISILGLVGFAMLAMAIVVVFLPVSFMGGMAGQYFREFGLTVSVAVLFSLLVARLVTPLMAAYLLKAKPHATVRKPFTGLHVRGWPPGREEQLP